jgi:RNA polymerase sigma-70 factor, ECF subfamily
MKSCEEVKLNCNVPELWNQHKKTLKQFIRRRVGSEDTTEDILQEVLLKVYNFCMTRSGVRNVNAWLFQIAQNTITDHYRKNKNTVLVDNVPETGAEMSRSRLEAADYIIPLIGLLPENYAVPLKLSDIDGMKHKEIALSLNLGLSATKSRIQRARQLLMNKFIECCDFEKDKKGNLVYFEIKSHCKPLQDYKRLLNKQK